jgi:DNA-binding SARP family transcriptional activator
VSALDGTTDVATPLAGWPVVIGLFGGFRLIRSGHSVPLRAGGKGELLLSALALSEGFRAPRARLLEMLWPEREPARAAQSLNTLVYDLHRLLGGELHGATPIVYADACYRLHSEAGVGVDVACFDALVATGERLARAGDVAASLQAFRSALELYRGDIVASDDLHDVVQRERLRAVHLTLLAHLADHHFRGAEYATALGYSLRLLQSDPCREDAHRVAMRCHVRQGARAQALRQYRLCEEILRREFDAVPEPATLELFDRVRLHPALV